MNNLVSFVITVSLLTTLNYWGIGRDGHPARTAREAGHISFGQFLAVLLYIAINTAT